jgi:uncharacterized membrane protein YraQ (UPF0718 family)/copper chaperone CopZ
MSFYVAHIASATWQTLQEMAPYLLFGFLVAGVLSIVVSPETIERQLGRPGIWSILKAALFGVPLPLCSCGVIPVTASLRNHGASKGAATSFLISTPQTGVDSLLVTYSMLGPVFTIVRPVVSLVSGVLGGVAVDIADGEQPHSGHRGIKCTGECCSPTAGQGTFVRILKYGFGTLAADIAKPLLIGIVIAGVLSGVVPKGSLGEYLGGGGIGRQLLSMLAMMIIGLPLYVCATASVPVAAAMIHLGVSPGAALVFLMTGPATNAASVATIWKVMGRRTAVVYAITVAASAFIAGLALNWIDPGAASMADAGHEMLPAWAGTVSAVVLLAVLGVALMAPYFGKGGHDDHDHDHDHGNEHEHATQTITLEISGMTCSHCASNVGRALQESQGVESVSVDLKSGSATVSGDGIDLQKLKKKIQEAGYEIADVVN